MSDRIQDIVKLDSMLASGGTDYTQITMLAHEGLEWFKIEPAPGSFIVAVTDIRNGGVNSFGQAYKVYRALLEDRWALTMSEIIDDRSWVVELKQPKKTESCWHYSLPMAILLASLRGFRAELEANV